MSTPSVPLRSAPPNCPRCGRPMEPGYVQGDSAGFQPASILWANQKTEEMELAPLPFWRWSESPRLPPSRCGACRLILVDYGAPPVK